MAGTDSARCAMDGKAAVVPGTDRCRHHTPPPFARIPAPRDPIHDRPAAPQMESLRHDLQTMHGKLLHAVHEAEARGAIEARDAYRHAVALVAELCWPGAA